MRLHSIEILPRGINGWGSSELLFGKHITSLYANNGSGKTPIIQAIVYCLGNPVTFREDISSKCEMVRLQVLVGEQNYTIERAIDKELFISVIDTNGKRQSFNNEKDYSNFLFGLFGMNIPALVGSNFDSAQPYMATNTPIFYIDQDHGYLSAYYCKANFIRDQFVETVRFLFGFQPKNSFDIKKTQILLRDQLGAVDRKIVTQQKIVGDLNSEIIATETKSDLDTAIESIKEQLNKLQTGTSQKQDTDTILNELYSSKNQAIQRTARELDGLRDRVNGIEAINHEILAEIDTLSLNEEARRIFISFGEICASKNCCLLESSSQQYAKNLLYLKDQIKDLERNAEFAGERISLLEQQLNEQKIELKSIGDGIQRNKQESNISGIVDAVRRLTQELIELESRRTQLEMRDRQNTIYVELTSKRYEIQTKLDLISSSGERDLDFSRFKIDLKGEIVRWLDILKTKNVPRNITIENNLRIDFGGEQLDVFKGSTKTRIILAIHAALLQLYVKNKSRSFRFLILDTPRQHEIHTDDLMNYLNELKKLASENDAQVILSSTQFSYSCDSDDKEWLPLFSGVEQNMYLGVSEALINQASAD